MKKNELLGWRECSLCGYTRKLKEFKKDNRRPLGRGSWCSECSRKKGREYYHSNKERRLAMNRDDYYKHAEDRREKERLRRLKRKKEVFDHYGNYCDCCGEDRVEFMTIDHIGGGGNEHRRQIAGGRGGTAFYLWLIKNKFPEGFRTLCHNCNWVTGHYGYCPHEKNEVSRNRRAVEALSAEDAGTISRYITPNIERFGMRRVLYEYISALEDKDE